MKRPARNTKSLKRRKISVNQNEENDLTDSESSPILWPEYFCSRFRVFKAINTVLGFVSSRKHLATTFSVVRLSVEALLKHSLDLEIVAELKALLPDMIKFSYIPKNELYIHGNSRSSFREASADFALSSGSSNLPRISATGGDDEHVLVLDFADNSRGRKQQSDRLAPPPSLTPSAIKALIEKRNARFRQAVDELLSAMSGTDDAVRLLQAAAKAHMPVNPSASFEKKGLAPAQPNVRPAIGTVIAEMKEQAWYKGQILESRVFGATEGQTALLEPPLPPSIASALNDARNIQMLYLHQVLAIRALSRGKNVIVSTGTASGKSVIYQIPIMQFLEADPSSTAIFVYPTKALAQDQKTAMEQLIWSCPGLQHIKVATFDGDTTEGLREEIRESASVIFTNFDMLHASVLPHEIVWRRFFKNLKLFVIDELHYYSGLFGSHVAQIIRRLRRVCAAVGNRHIQFISCSATISNPRVHMKNMVGLELADIEVVTEDGSPSGQKHFLIWNSPFKDPMAPSLGRHSSLSEATGLMRFLMKRGIRVILFCKIRKVCELAMKTIRADLSNEGRLDILEKTMPYRGGYSQEERRCIERDAFNGRLLGIISTNALELGVDIGVLDAVIMLGFPSTIASFWQQAGRAGRRSRDSLIVFVADSLPIDQHYVENPGQLFEKASDDLIVDLESKVIVEAHLQCAGYEMPLSLEDEKYFGPMTRELCETYLLRDEDGWYHTHPKFLPYPSKNISIRGIQEDKYDVVDVTGTNEGRAPSILEEVEVSRAMFEVYEGGVVRTDLWVAASGANKFCQFMHQGLTFIVKEVSHDSKVAQVIRADVNWITSPRDFTNVDAVRTFRVKEIKSSPYRAYYGKIEVMVKVFGFFKIRSNIILDTVDLYTPTWERDTTGLWIDLPRSLLDLFKNKGIHPAEAIHAAQHAFLNKFCLAQDIKTECKAAEKEYKTKASSRKRPARLIFYDAIGQGGSMTAKAFDNVHDTLKKAHQTVASCNCQRGCITCVQSPACKEGNLVCSKIGALLVLRSILGLEIDPSSIPYQGNGTQPLDTIIEASSVCAIDGIQVETDIK